MPLTRFRHGAGLWTLQSKQEKKLYHLAYTEPLRRSFRAICGFSCRGLDDLAVYACLGVLSPDQARAADLIRHAGWLLSDGSPILSDLWFDRGPWHQDVLWALQQCGETLGDSTAYSWDALVSNPARAKDWARQFARRCRAQAKRRRDTVRQQWSNLAAARAQGAFFIHCEVKDRQESLHYCKTCRQEFNSAAALGAHNRKVHGQIAQATAVANGSRCEACGVEFWSTARLRDHLRRQRVCLETWVAADIMPTEEVRPTSYYAWRPACKAYGPTPWWATLRPQDPSDAEALQDTRLPDVFACWLPTANSEPGESQVHRLVEYGIRHELSVEDLPIAVLQNGTARSDLAQCALFAAQHILAQSAGYCELGHWKVVIRSDRAIITPVDVFLPRPLPGVWEEG